jgi:DNA repair protein RecO (recombination protein O)
MERFQKTVGIVIKSKSIKESDLLVTLLTPHLGKITVLAKGAKNIRSSRLGTLQLGNIVKTNLYRKNDFLWLSESTVISHFMQIPKKLTQLNLLFYFLELLNYFIADNQQIDGIYQISENLITSINKNQLDQFIKYEIQFVQILGFGLPDDIQATFNSKDYISCQKYIKTFLESIIEKPLMSNQLFS